MSDARQTRNYLTRLLARHGCRPRGDLGQNFLIDLNLLDLVVRAAEPGPDDVVLEVGAGTGSLTALLARAAGSVVSVEIDPNLYRLAGEAVADCENVTLLHGDALATKNRLSAELLDTLAPLLEGGRPLKLVANLPYSVATPVISNFVGSELNWTRIVATIQWELALRMTARPATGQYGALAVWLQAQTDVEILKKLGSQVFWPRPEVESAIVRLTPNAERGGQIADRAFFHDFLKQVFTQRRKLLRPVLASRFRGRLSKAEIEVILDRVGGAQSRAEALTVAQLVELGNQLHQAAASADAR